MLRILITGGRNPTALELARLLCSPQTELWLADSLLFPIGRHSRCIHRYVRTPRVAQETEAYLGFLQELVVREKIDVLIPTYEETFYIARYRHRLEGLCTIFCDDFDKLQRLHHKWDFVQMVAESSIKAPPTFLLRSPEDVALLKDDASYYVFKPAYSRFATQILIRPEAQQLRFLRPQHHAPWIAQWFVEGAEYCSYSIAYRGRVTAHVTYEHPHNLGRGSGIYYRAVAQPMIEQFVRAFCHKHQYHGQIGFDFIQDQRDGKLYVIECNPRTVSGLHLFSPDDELLRGMVGPTPAVIQPGRLVPRVNLLTYLVYNGWKALRQGQLRQWYHDLWKAQDVIFRWNDPWPMLTQNLTLLEFFWFSFKYGLPLSEAISHDIAWNGVVPKRKLRRVA